jgi:hypothetical protein
MQQREVEYAVARVTGESLGTIRRHGFVLVDSLSSDRFDPEPNDLPAQMIDWDNLPAPR